jgi:hypothetical protein
MQALAFSNQQQGELFPEYRPTVHLHTGYKWDETYTQVNCLIGYPNSLTGHSWVALIPESGDVSSVIETTPENIIEKENKKLEIKIKRIKVKNEKIAKS